MKKYKGTLRCTAWMLLLVNAFELVWPNRVLALTTGPTQPEVLSFEPVGTTDMVETFSGDFVYNIPLLDVEGYPVNISYHGGVTMEQEASWVGLGWNINPGEINRTVRGVPDDFNGEVLSKQLHIKDDITTRVGLGGGAEFFGKGDPDVDGKKISKLSVDLSAYANFNNYRGISCDFGVGVGFSICKHVSAGLNLGIGSQSGLDIDYNVNLSTANSQKVTDQEVSQQTFSAGLGVNHGFSSRAGVKELSLNVNFSGSSANPDRVRSNNIAHRGNNSSASQSFNYTVLPIGLKNYVPVITNSTTMNTIYGRLKVGTEVKWGLPYIKASASYTTVHFNDDGSRKAFGYLYLQNSQNTSNILDFTRDKDGMFNKSMEYLPPANITYDVYSASGQGTGGVFRPFRNDLGTVFDPYMLNDGHSNSAGLEVGLGDIFEIGGDYTLSLTQTESGPWSSYLQPFKHNKAGSVFENVYFKQAGDLTATDLNWLNLNNSFKPIFPGDVNKSAFVGPTNVNKRAPRSNLIYYYTAKEDTIPGVSSVKDILSYTGDFSSGPHPTLDTVKRIGTNALERRKDQISEIVQLQKDGRKYVYGIPAMNNLQRDATFSVNGPISGVTPDGLITYIIDTDDAVLNGKGIDNYYSNTLTPSYAHSYLLTSVQSTDYVDVTGNGISDDDLGSYTKFNYSLKEKDYRWKAPFPTGKAQYSRGYLSDTKDDKANVSMGSREEWMLHSIETKNFIAEFYTSPRNDAAGSKDAIALSGPYAIAPYNAQLSQPAPSYKLDSIKLFNKHDRFINTNSAIPVKSVFFVYTDTLCRGIPNVITGSGSRGKLTLSRIYMQYGNSGKSLMSPYQFSYGINPDYSPISKDRWGNYKPNTGMGNVEFPFVDQTDSYLNDYASAWSLTNITLPSGGVIHVNYESDDYAYVQDKQASEMFIVKGIGNGPAFNPSNQLYGDRRSPYLYLYFKRRTDVEIGSHPYSNYLDKGALLYYNCNVKMRADVGKFEQIKGYAKVDEVGYCPGDGVQYGYIKLEPKDPEGGADFRLNPISFTAINTGTYSLPQTMYQGSDPDISMGGAIGAMFNAFGEITSLWRNPIIKFIHRRAAKTIVLDKSYIRLKSPGWKKKGGGQRVKSMLFYDNWDAQAGGSEQAATYGKNYDYAIEENGARISSGVASYEPLIGGDENSLRGPAPYHGAEGRKWPPVDPVELFQEKPIGESFYPPGNVGYSKVTVSSIHADVGKSSQGVDIYEYYTTRDFPYKVMASGLFNDHSMCFGIFKQSNRMWAEQGFSFILNDMHGKPKKNSHYVYNKSQSSLVPISSQEFHYRKNPDGSLNNTPNCLVYNPVSYKLEVAPQTVGIEADMTMDSRQRHDETLNLTFNINLNVSELALLIVPIFFAYPWPGEYENTFECATVTKIIQQYGIVESVTTTNENSIVVQKNELFDPQSGQVVVTSFNNEYKDNEFSASIPAYWGYKGMGPAYENIMYEADLSPVSIGSDHIGRFASDNNLRVGDELLLTDSLGRNTIVWFLGSKNTTGGCEGMLLPRFPLNTPRWDASHVLTHLHCKVIRSGNRNMLEQKIENYTMLGNPISSGGWLRTTIDSVISLNAISYSDSNTRLLRSYMSNMDTINPYATGERGVYRQLNDFAYVTDRNYTGVTSRYAGLFSNTDCYYRYNEQHLCTQYPHNYLCPNNSANWRTGKTATKFALSGTELENKDAVANFSNALFGYNDDLPVAVAGNARQGEIFSDGFEDYKLLRIINNITRFDNSFVKNYFNANAVGSSTIYEQLNVSNPNGLNVVTTAAHTGIHSLIAMNSNAGSAAYFNMPLAIKDTAYSSMFSRYNSYFWDTGYHFSPDNEYLPFKLTPGKKYVFSFWAKDNSAPVNPTTYSIDTTCGIDINSVLTRFVKTSNIIEGWQQYEAVFAVPAVVTSAELKIPIQFFIDDMRFAPQDASVKTFVYHPFNEKLMATLDENNFAKIYEYDQEGNLVRVKKETERGIMTVSESRSNHPTQ